jgi:hypothetical protein
MGIENTHQNQGQENYQYHKQYNSCKYFLKKFYKCINNYNDVTNCRIFLDSYKKCINNYNPKQI